MAKRKRSKRRSLGGLGEVTKRDFQAIADILCEHGAPQAMVNGFVSYFASQNPSFDSLRFVRATGSCRRKAA